MKEDRSEFRDDTFTDIVVGDVAKLQERLVVEDTQSSRRDLIRAIFAAIEGLHWRAKQNVLTFGVSHLTAHEYAALSEESYNVSDGGKIRAVPRFLPTTASIRLLVRTIQKLNPDYNLDFQHAGWAGLKAAVNVRNRLIHPKTREDLEVSDQDIEASLRGFNWMLALVIDAHTETLSYVVARFDKAAKGPKPRD